MSEGDTETLAKDIVQSAVKKINPDDLFQAMQYALEHMPKTMGNELLPLLFDAKKNGNIIFMSGDKGTGKSHESTNFIYHLLEKTDYACITNIKFIDPNEDKNFPDDVYFAQSFQGMWQCVSYIRREDPWKPIIVVIDEFQKTVHRNRTTSSEALAVSRLLSEARKNIMSFLFITQFVEMIPRELLHWSAFFIHKLPELTKRYNGRYRKRILEDRDNLYTKKELSYLKQVKRHRCSYHNDKDSVEKIRCRNWEEEYIKDLRDIDDVFYAGVTDYTDVDEDGIPQTESAFSTHGSATFSLRPLDDDPPQTWLPELKSDLGEAVPKEVPEVINDFFQSYTGNSAEGVDPADLVEELFLLAQENADDLDENGYPIVELGRGRGYDRVDVPLSPSNLMRISGVSRSTIYQRLRE